MDVTDNRGYPYPECDPPLVKDASDAPAQTRALAEAFDADVTAYDDRRHAVYDRLTAVMRLAVGVVILSNGQPQPLPFDTSQYDSGGMIDLAADAFVVPSSGLYQYTIYISTAAGHQLIQAWLIINGILQYCHAADSPNVAGLTQVNSSSALMLNTGDIVQFKVSYSASDTVTAYAGLTQIGPS